MFITKKNTNEEELKSDNKQYSISFSANTIDFKLLNSLIPYYKVRKIIYKGRGTDSLFIRVSGTGKNLLKLFNKYNKILKNLTYEEQHLLQTIKNKSYVTKKYNFSEDITLEEEEELFKIYLPNEQVDYYNDYYNYNNQEKFYTKRINYEKSNNIKKDVVSKILQSACKTITNFKLSIVDKKIDCFKDNKLDCVAIFNYRIEKKEKKLKSYYKVAQKEGATYNNYTDFIKSVVCYGTTQTLNNRFWQIIKRELY